MQSPTPIKPEIARTDSAKPDQPAPVEVAAPKAPPQTQAASNTNIAVQGNTAPQSTTTPSVLPGIPQHVQVSAEAAKPSMPALAVEIAAKSQSGAKQFDIRLDPPELGRVEVRLSIDAAGKASAHLSADQPQTLELLQKDAASLTRALREAGLNVSQDGLNFSLRQQSHDGNGTQQGSGAPGVARHDPHRHQQHRSHADQRRLSRRRPAGHPGLRTKIMITPTSSSPTATNSTDPALKQLSGNFSTFLNLPHHAVEEPGPHQPDGHQPVHPAVGDVQPGRAADSEQQQLQALIAQGQSSASQMAMDYLGKRVSIMNGQASLIEGEANWTYNLPSAAASAKLTVTNSAGRWSMQRMPKRPRQPQFEVERQGQLRQRATGRRLQVNRHGGGSRGRRHRCRDRQRRLVTIRIDMTGAEPKLIIGYMQIGLGDVAAIAN